MTQIQQQRKKLEARGSQRRQDPPRHIPFVHKTSRQQKSFLEENFEEASEDEDWVKVMNEELD